MGQNECENESNMPITKSWGWENKPKLKRLNSKPIDYEVGTIGQNGCNYGLNLKNEKPRSWSG